MRNKNAILGFAGCVALVFAAEAYFLTVKIPSIDSEFYERRAADLEVRDGWRVGYLHGMHGALLVKTPDSGRSPRAPEDEQSRTLHALMSRELRNIPIKTALEIALYLVIAGFVLFLAPALRRVVRGRSPGRLRSFAGDLIGGAMVFGLAAAPLLVLGYGYGGFSNVVGPDPISYSGPYFHWQSWTHDSSNSISYRAFVSPLVLPPGVLVQLFWSALRHIPVYGELLDDDSGSTAAFWIAGAIFYGGMGALGIRTLTSFRRRRAARSGYAEAGPSI